MTLIEGSKLCAELFGLIVWFVYAVLEVRDCKRKDDRWLCILCGLGPPVIVSIFLAVFSYYTFSKGGMVIP